MSVLVRGMEMPASCIACRLGRETNYAGDFEEKCLVNGKCGYVSIRKPRLETCPLVEVPTPHGDLIDIDAFRAEHGFGRDCSSNDCPADMRYSCMSGYSYTIKNICGWLDDAPPIIEAEGSGT